MIFKKDSTFPYPILSNFTDDYQNSELVLEVSLNEDTSQYIFNVSYKLDSSFISACLIEGLAEVIVILESQDCKYWKMESTRSFIQVPKSRLALSTRSQLQIMIVSKMEISMSKNDDLVPYYDDIKGEISIPPNSVMAISNVIIYDGSNKNPFELFEKQLDPSLSSDIAIILGSETIIIKYKKEDFQFVYSHMSKDFNYPYVYMGLQKALQNMITKYDEDDAEGLMIGEMDPPTDGLSFKLYQLMKSKGIDVLNEDNIDDVIHRISDRIIERYSNAIRKVSQSGN